jgi:hypothetical protein
VDEPPLFHPPSSPPPSQTHESSVPRSWLTDTIIILFEDDLALPYEHHAERSLRAGRQEFWTEARRRCPTAALRPVFEEAPISYVRVQGPRSSIPSLDAAKLEPFFAISCAGVRDIAAVARWLREQTAVVAMAYVDRKVAAGARDLSDP